MFRKVMVLLAIGGLWGCAYRIPVEDVQLLPGNAARSILEKWYGSNWVTAPDVQGTGFTDACNSSRRRVVLADFVSAHYSPGVLMLITADGVWTTCAYTKNVPIPSLEEAKQAVAAVNTLGGRIDKLKSSCGVVGVSCNMGIQQ